MITKCLTIIPDNAEESVACPLGLFWSVFSEYDFFIYAHSPIRSI